MSIDNNVQNNTCHPCSLACSAFTGASISYGIAWMFTAINPSVAAGFGASNALVEPCVERVFENCIGEQQSGIVKVAQWAVTFFISTAISVKAASLLGFVITMESAVALGLITFVVSNILPCVTCCACALGAIGLVTGVGAHAAQAERSS